ncbi:MAG TPA: YetF domain-containing protein [Burkholderiales bacterium]|nr:YetF domain-containing protein [Burkholderiales bacterium]
MPDWQELFGLTVSPVELMIRGSAVYWFLVIVFRVVLRRDTGSVGIADILLLVIIADAAQNAMAGEYRSITDGLILVSTIIGWNVLIDWLSYRYPAIRRIFEPRPLQLVRDGRILRRNLAKELVAESELMSKLRVNGVDDVKDVKAAYMEPDGEITVIKKNK